MEEKDNFDFNTMRAIKKLVTGATAKEEMNEYVLDEETGKMKLVKKRIKRNRVPPSSDMIKLIYSQPKEDEFSTYSDEELRKEKERLLNQLKDDD